MSELLRRLNPLAGLLAMGVLLMALPVLANTDYQLSLFTEFCITLLLLSGLNVISGHGGQMSLGQATFYGLGAYFAAIAVLRIGLSPLLGFLLAPLAAALVAGVVGLPSLRLRGLYFAMATLGVAVVFERLVNHATELTGGPNGLGMREPLALAGVAFDTPLALYYLAAVVCWIGIAVAQLYMRSRMGWSLRAAKASEPAAAVVGIDTSRIRLGAFVLSGAYAGLAGSLETFHSGYISPPTFGFFASVMLFVVLTIGGMGTFLGPAIGAFIMYAFSRWGESLSDEQPLILAAVFLVCLRLFPRGIAAELSERAARLRARRRGEAPDQVSESGPLLAKVGER